MSNKGDIKIIKTALAKELERLMPVGIDDGYRETKIYLHTGECLRINSQAKAGEQTQVSVAGGEKTIFQFDTKDGSYVIGDLSESDSTAFDDYPISAMNRVIVTFALQKAGLNSNSINISAASGLPIKKFYRAKVMNKEAIKAKQLNLLTNDVCEVDYTSNGRVESTLRIPTIKRHQIISEGIAAWMDYIFVRDEDGLLVQDKARLSEKIAIVDIGGRTTDIAVIQQGNLDFQRSNTIEAGMLNIEDYVKERILDEFEFMPNLEQLRNVMETGKLIAWGQEKDVSSFVKDGKKLEADKIKSEILGKLKKAADIQRVIFVGGTTMALSEYLEGIYPHQTIADNPGFANARGMCKYVEYQTLSNIKKKLKTNE